MRQAQYDVLMEQGKYDEIIEQLEEELQEEYDELPMLHLSRAYLAAGDDKKAKKVAKKCHNLFPAGEYIMKIEELLEHIEEGRVEEYLQSLKDRKVSKDRENHETQRKPAIQETSIQTEKSEAEEKPRHREESISLAEMLGRMKKKREKKPVQIPQNISECFEGVVGMENVQIELDKFYKLLRFQNERKESQFDSELLKSTHFAVAGARGSGKTLVGEIISGLLYDFGVRADNHAVSLDARELLAAYENNRTEGIKNLFAELEDITVIIENMQDILEDPADNSGNHDAKEIAVQLRRMLYENKDKLSIVLTGTNEAITKLRTLDDEIQDVLHCIIEIPDYSPMELLEIAKKEAAKKALRIHPKAKKNLLRKINMECRSLEFMNAITLNRYLNDASVKMAQRYFEGEDESESAKVYLMPEDFEVEMEEESLEELLQKLDNLTGLNNVKAQIRKRIETIAIEKQAEEKGAHREAGHGTLHMLFTGNPGTGKTTVANLIGKIYQQLGVLPSGHMVSCTRSDLVGQYQGQTAPLVKGKVKEAMGGILFIDEAYALCREDKDPYGHEAVDELIAAMENNKDYMMVILAGYKEEMQQFLKSNPGFKSRIRNEIEFEDYSVEEMTSIFIKMVAGKSMELEPDTEADIRNMLELKSKVPDFGNARGVRNLFDDVIEEMNSRLVRMSGSGMDVSAAQMDRITKADIQAVAGRKTDDEKSLDDLLEELNGLVGLESVKEKVQEMVDDIQFKAYMKENGSVHDQGHGTLNLIFTGNAGTGKTTVARLIGKIYKKLGLLKKNRFEEVGRKDLVGQYEGQTAKKVMEKIKDAEGGILFIDEVYTLINGEHDEFGREAINTLVPELENRRDSLMVIVAGYKEDMKKFLDANQGLASRLSEEIYFEDYSDEELLYIFQNMVEERGMRLAPDLEEVVKERIQKERENTKDFGNARGVRNLVEKVGKKKNSRIMKKVRAGMEPGQEELITICREDLTGEEG